MTVAVVIAVRGGASAKSRFGGTVDGAALAKAMLADMIAAARGCPAVEGVHVVTPTPEVAAGLDAELIVEAAPAGIDAAFARARAALPGRTLVLMLGDLPMMTADDLAALVAGHEPGTVTIVPSDTEGGTSTIVIDDGTPMRFAFGTGSFARHMENAGALARRFDCPGLAADLDRPEDVARVLAHGGAHSRACLTATRRDAA